MGVPQKKSLLVPENSFLCGDCMDILPRMNPNCVDVTLTDIPYDAVTRPANVDTMARACYHGVMDKGDADKLTFSIPDFLRQIDRVTRGCIMIFCGKEQFSSIFGYFANQKGKGTARQIIYERSDPMPLNGQWVYLSNVENCVWFRKSGWTFNNHCRGTVFRFAHQRNHIHPTEKPHKLLAELIQDNSDEGDLIFDPCAGSGSTLLVARSLKRNYFGIEQNQEFFEAAQQRLNQLQ